MDEPNQFEKFMDDFDKREELDYIAEITDVRLQVVKVITEVLSVDDEVDSLVKNKLTSLSKDIWEGSNEWEVLYNKYYEEEMNKKGL